MPVTVYLSRPVLFYTCGSLFLSVKRDCLSPKQSRINAMCISVASSFSNDRTQKLAAFRSSDGVNSPGKACKSLRGY